MHSLTGIRFFDFVVYTLDRIVKTVCYVIGGKNIKYTVR